MKSLLFLAVLVGLGLYGYSWHFFITVFIISFLVFFHELGHFLAARSLGVCVDTFSIGFGEKLLKKRIGQTEYAFSAIPLGGYVKLKGQDDIDPNHKNYDPDSYNSLKPLGRIYILFAGPFFNLFLAFLIYFALAFLGTDKLAPIVGSVLENSAAQTAGLEKNDKILSINNIEIKQWDDISKNVKLESLNLIIERNGKQINMNLTPQTGDSISMFGEKIKKPLIGISPSRDVVKIYYSGFDAFKYAFDETILASKLIFLGFEKLITGIIPIKEMGGIVQITDITSNVAKTNNITALLILTALISVNLGILNLLPIPALDGGHIIFNTYELIFRREVSQKAFVWLTYFGWALLLTLMLVATFNDIMRLSGVYK